MRDFLTFFFFPYDLSPVLSFVVQFCNIYYTAYAVDFFLHSHPQSSRSTFGTPTNTGQDDKKGTSLFFFEIFFNPVTADSIEHIQAFFPL